MRLQKFLSKIGCGSKVPYEINDLPINDSIVKAEYRELLDSVFTIVDTFPLVALNIGNEHGSWLFNTDDFIGRIGEFMDFFIDAKAYAEFKYEQTHPGEDLMVGTTFTYAFLTDTNTREFIKYINDSAYTDMISVNYYGQDTAFNVLPPEQIPVDFDTLVSIYNDPSKPIYFTECGYQSSDTCNSSEQLQSEFVEQVFNAWDQHYDQIKYISFFKSTDWSEEVAQYIVDQMAFPGWSDEKRRRFKEYLRTLGLKNFDNTEKLAYQKLIDEATARGFCPESGVESRDEEKIQVYPNPASDIFNISGSSIESIRIFDITGKLMFAKNVKPLTNIDIKTDNWKEGLYFISLFDGKLLHKRKVVIVK